MSPIERDAAYIWDMLDSARTIQAFMVGMHFEEFLQDRKLQLAIERCVEIIGEASRVWKEKEGRLYGEYRMRKLVLEVW